MTQDITGRGSGGDDGRVSLGSRLRGHLERARRKEVLDNVSGPGGLFAFETKGYKRPVLVSSCKGLGPKVALARQFGRFEGIGADLVALVVDDLAVTGAEPLFFQDYLAAGRLQDDEVDQIVAGIAGACSDVGCALVGGQTVEQAGVLAAGHYDMAGFGVGVVEAQKMLGPGHVAEGDAVVAMASNGLHTTGYDVAQRIVAGRDPYDDHGLLVQSLGEALLRPARVYSRECRALAGAVGVHALCPVTSGGLARKLAGELPDHLGAVVDTRTFEVPRLFRLLQEWGEMEEDEMWRVFNMGVGMLAVVDDGERAVNFLRGGGTDAWVCGSITARPGVNLVRN